VRVLILNRLLYLFEVRIERKSKRKTGIGVGIIVLIRELGGRGYKDIYRKY
jgi:hypothetical protein